MSMIVRITLEMALGKEFDYEVPEALVDRVAWEVASRFLLVLGR